MAKTFGPLHSDSASGTLAGVLTFSQRASGSQCRIQRKQKDYENPARKVVRDAFRQGVKLWRSLPSNEKALWGLY